MPGETREPSSVPDELNKEIGAHKAPEEQKVSEEEVLGLYAKEEAEEKNKEEELALEKQAKEIVESFYSRQAHGQGSYRPLKEKQEIEEIISNLPEALKAEVFSCWLPQTYEAFGYIDLFGKLPSSLQKEVAEYYPDLGSHYHYDAVIHAFGEITDADLTEAMLKKHKFEWLVNRKDKLKLVTDDQLLDMVRNDDEAKSLDWVELVPYIDQFPSVNKQEAFEGALKQKFSSSGVTSGSKIHRGTSESSTFDLLIRNREKLGLSFRELLDALYENKKYDGFDALLANLDVIPPEYHQEIADKLIEDKNIYLLINGSRHLKNVDVPEIIKKISETTGFPKSRSQDEYRSVSGIEAMAHNIEYIAEPWGQYMDKELIDKLVDIDPEDVARSADKLGEKVDKEKLVEMLFNNERFTFLINTAEKLDIKLDSDFAEKLIKSGAEGARALFNNFTKFEKLPRNIYLDLIEFFKKENIEPKEEYFREFIFHFTGLLKEDALNAIKATKYGDLTTQIINKCSLFEGLSLNQEFADFLLEEDRVALIDNFDKFEGVDYKKVANHFVGLGEGAYIAYRIEKFRGIENDREIGIKIFEALFKVEWDLPKMAEICELYKPPLDKTFLTAYSIFGDYLTKKEYETIGKVESGEISKEELKELGIKKSGKDGINQLRERISKFKSEILEEDFDPEILQESGFYKQYFKAYVRLDVSEWGEHDEREFNSVVGQFTKLKEKGKLAPLPEGYEPSGEMRIDRIDRERQESFEYSEQFWNRYDNLESSLHNALLMLKNVEKPLHSIVESVARKREKILEGLKGKLNTTANPKAKENLTRRIENLEKIDLESVKDFQGNFAELAQFNEFHEEIRELTFYVALHKHKNYSERMWNIVHKEPTSHQSNFEKVNEMINFVEHIVNEETWKKYFTNKKALKAFENVVNVRTLEEEFAKAQNQATKGTVAMEFIPTRGLLMEFSGHIADACWASKYDNIAQEFPNFSATVMVQNRGTKNERLAGASMMLETDAEDGTPLLVIRGLNPIENVINAVSVEDFFDKFVEYARNIAEKRGRKLAIVIDDHSGGSGTNRPVLFNLLENKLGSLEKVKLKSEDDTTFNEYNIVYDTYLV